MFFFKYLEFSLKYILLNVLTNNIFERMKSVLRRLARKSEKFGVEKTLEGPARHPLHCLHQQDERGPFDQERA